MDRYLLRYFLAVAELGSFSKAAARVSVTQPTLSVGIAKLEAELGARLFERTTRRVSLTPAGSRFLAHARAISHEYEAALRDVARSPQLKRVRAGVRPLARARRSIVSCPPSAKARSACKRARRPAVSSGMVLTPFDMMEIRSPADWPVRMARTACASHTFLTITEHYQSSVTVSRINS